MSKTILFAAAAAATLLGSLTSFTPTAEAGGIRVGFGLPLGGFTATPTRGGYAAGKSCKKKSPSYASRSRPASKVASRPSKETKVASHSYSAPKKSRSVNRAESNDTETAENSNETSTTGSTALIQADSNKADITTVEIPADLPPEGTTTTSTETTTETTVTSTPVANAAGDAEIPAAETPAPAPVVEEAPKSKKSKTAKKEDCTKYIPSIGVTVSVGC